jgi:hypothetical protein
LRDPDTELAPTHVDILWAGSANVDATTLFLLIYHGFRSIQFKHGGDKPLDIVLRVVTGDMTDFCTRKIRVLST